MAECKPLDSGGECSLMKQVYLDTGATACRGARDVQSRCLHGQIASQHVLRFQPQQGSATGCDRATA